MTTIEAHQKTEAGLPRRSEAETGINRGLETLDEAVRNAGNQGPPGSGIFLLLSDVAAQLGIPRVPFPAAPSLSPSETPDKLPAASGLAAPKPEVKAGATAEKPGTMADAKHGSVVTGKK